MAIRAKQKAKDLITIRTGNPMEMSWALNYLNNAKRIPEQARPVISVKNMNGDEIKLPPSPKPMEVKMPMELKPQVVPPISGSESRTQVLTCGDNVRVQAQNIGTNLPTEPLRPGPTISLVPPGESPGLPPQEQLTDKDIQKIAEGIAIGKAADAVQKILEEKKDEPN
jgi:hypothetical protein